MIVGNLNNPVEITALGLVFGNPSESILAESMPVFSAGVADRILGTHNEMKNIITAFALTFAAILTASAQTISSGIYLDVQGPSGVVRPGDSFQLTYTLTWDNDFLGNLESFQDSPSVIGLGVANHQWAAWRGNIMQLTDVESHLSSDFILEVSHGWTHTGETGFSLVDWNIGGGLNNPPVLTATVTYQTFTHTPEQQYIMALNLDWFATYVMTSDYQMLGFMPENVNLYVLTVSSVPEPSTYAAGIGIVALIATALIRRRNKRSCIAAFSTESRDAA